MNKDAEAQIALLSKSLADNAFSNVIRLAMSWAYQDAARVCLSKIADYRGSGQISTCRTVAAAIEARAKA